MKKDIAHDKIQAASEKFEVELTPKRREFLAVKAERLYSKFCGLHGEGICAESFAEYQYA